MRTESTGISWREMLIIGSLGVMAIVLQAIMFVFSVFNAAQ
jgi:hypothetical protein